VVSFRGFDVNFAELDRADYYDAVWSSADAIHYLGNDLWARACRRGCPPKKMKALIPPAIDTGFFQPAVRPQPSQLGTRERPLRILSVGRLEWKKGYEFALEAVSLLRQQGFAVEFHIVGGGDYLEAVAFCRKQLGLEDCVTLLGALSPDEVLRQMHWADVFLHAAVSEGFCNAVVEAQATGLPVVTSDADGLGENVEDGLTGFVAPRRDPRALAERLAVLAQDARIRGAMAENGPARVRERFQLDSQIQAFARLYRQTCFIAYSRGVIH
jgi:colanic acid/amylovoran biosynthesis glycosyltransferase